MTLAELLGQEVTDADGTRLGHVHDVRVTLDDRRIRELVVGLGAAGHRLGYATGRTAGPWLVRVVAGWLSRTLHRIPWDHVTMADGGLRLDVTVDDLARLGPSR